MPDPVSAQPNGSIDSLTGSIAQQEYDTLQSLEWPVIARRLAEHCWTPYGETLWQRETFLEGSETVSQHLAQVEALKILILRYGEPLLTEPLGESVQGAVDRVAKGGQLNARELGLLLKTLIFGEDYLGHFKKHHGKEKIAVETLKESLGTYEAPQDLLEYLGIRVSLYGDILDTASLRLGQLREKRKHQREKIQSTLNQYRQKAEYRPALQENLITERDGRFVLPVKVEFKSKIPGVIHAGSSSGSTLYVEPNDAIPLNNSLQETDGEILKEIQAILKEVSAYLEAEAPRLREFLDLLGWVDKRAAAARLSLDLVAQPVEVLGDGQAIDLKGVRHPLLFLAAADKKAIVANDVALGTDDHRMMVITGPNTGGKTVLLKTVGLCALMLRAGLHLPVKENSRMSLFDPILADIGDHQSIAQNLSTFSAHVKNLNAFVDEDTELDWGLILIDEICAGTDPAEGAALARAVLDRIHAKNALTIVTTHLGELKMEAHQHPGYINASVEFDPEALRPTYRLLVGVPGTSNAITIAEKLGLPEAIISQSRALLSRPHRESAELLEELEQRNRKLAEELHKATAFRESSEATYQKVEFERQKLEGEKRQQLQQFKANLKDRIHTLEAEIKHLKQELRDKQHEALDGITGKLKALDTDANTLFEETYQELDEDSKRLSIVDLRVGDMVRSKRWGVEGTITAIELSSGQISLTSGMMQFKSAIEDLEIPQAITDRKNRERKLKQQKRSSAAMAGRVLTAGEGLTSTECNLLGLTVEVALEKMEQFLDKASLAGLSEVSIIHGHGSGALKKAVRAYLKDSPYAESFGPGDPMTGGDGQTQVKLG